MPEKGFDLKVLIPTDDGLTISKNGIRGALYYLFYNVSNRSYQLAGKIKTAEWYQEKKFRITDFKMLLTKEKIDLVLTLSATDINLLCRVKVINNDDIALNLNQLIDSIDKKRANLS
ncbi:MAG: hypothetical protein U9P82_03315 [Bacteroidota bacterium]|nr:hypothetical protein [Bacteroidota bacterium]